MSDAEKALLKSFAKDLADKYLPELIKAEMEHIPDGPVKDGLMVIEPLLMPKLSAFLDEKVNAL